MTDASDRYLFDRAIESGMAARIVGIDEAGRGPLAGPVVAAAVCLDPADPIEGVNDSKKLPASRRNTFYDEITRRARGFGIGIASVEEIGRVNILRATFLAMRRALDQVRAEWSLALIDGNAALPSLSAHSQLTVVGGDAKSASIAAASILAKVFRDRLMDEYHDQYPLYGFNRHRGYATAHHREQLLRFGLCPIHRRSFCEPLLLQTEMELFPEPQGVPA